MLPTHYQLTLAQDKVGELQSALKAWTNSLPFNKTCGNGCLLEPIRKVDQHCTPKDYDPRFAAFGEMNGNTKALRTPHAALAHMCWPAPLLNGLT